MKLSQSSETLLHTEGKSTPCPASAFVGPAVSNHGGLFILHFFGLFCSCF